MPDTSWRALIGQAKRSFWLLFGGIWLLAGLILLVVGIGSILEERRWSDAVTTTGMVLTKDIVPADSDSSTQYRVTFRYADERGETREGDEQVDVRTWEALTERGPVPVHYLPGTTEPGRLVRDPDLLGSALFLLVGLAGTIFGGVVFGRAARRLLQARRLLTTGRDVEATVTAVETTDVSYNQRPQFRVRYTYVVDGGTHVGDSGYLEWEEATSYSKGDRVAIRYDPERPADSLWIGRSGSSVQTPDAADPEPSTEGAGPATEGAGPATEGAGPATQASPPR
jgi:hypothetical protein